MALVRCGSEQRRSAATAANADSSRSHAVLACQVRRPASSNPGPGAASRNLQGFAMQRLQELVTCMSPAPARHMEALMLPPRVLQVASSNVWEFCCFYCSAALHVR